MKRLVVSLFLSLFLPVQASWFGYDRGIAAAHDGNSERAVKLLTDELTSYPENPELLYDSGVLASRQKSYEQAEAFFSKTIVFTASDSQLHRQALFNLGNACVGATKLHEALNAYNQLLELDPQHKKARHNRDVVKKMLEQQEQDQEQNGSQQDNKKDNQGNSKQQSSDKEQKQSQQDGNKNSSEQQQGKQDDAGKQQNGQSQGNQQQNSGQQQSDKQHDGGDSQKEQQKSGKQPSGAGQHKQQSSEKDSANNEQQTAEQKATDQQSPDGTSPDGTSPDSASRNQDNQKRDGKDSNQLDERDGYKERYGKRDNHTDGKDKQQSGSDKADDVKNNADDKEGGNDQRTQQHDDSPPRARGAHKDVTTTKTMKVGSKVQESAKKETKKQYAAWAESMLDAVQLNDEALNKVLVQRAVAGAMGGRDGECCW
jgi:Ca-activated chloride channel family protein